MNTKAKPIKVGSNAHIMLMPHERQKLARWARNERKYRAFTWEQLKTEAVVRYL